MRPAGTPPAASAEQRLEARGADEGIPLRTRRVAERRQVDRLVQAHLPSLPAAHVPRVVEIGEILATEAREGVEHFLGSVFVRVRDDDEADHGAPALRFTTPPGRGQACRIVRRVSMRNTAHRYVPGAHAGRSHACAHATRAYDRRPVAFHAAGSPGPDLPVTSFVVGVPIRVIVGEDHYLVREGLRQLIDAEPDIDAVAYCDGLASLQKATEEAIPDVVVTDIRMPPLGSDEGIRFATWARETHPQIGVVVLSQYAQAEYALRLFEGGRPGARTC